MDVRVAKGTNSNTTDSFSRALGVTVLMFFVAFVLTHSPLSSAASLHTSVVTDVNDLGGPGPTRFERNGNATSGPLVDSESTTVGDATGSSSVSVDFGSVRAKGDAIVAAIGTMPFTRIANGAATGTWVDDIVIDHDSLDGEFFSVSFLVEITGSLDVPVIGPPGGAVASANWSATLYSGDVGSSRIIDVDARFNRPVGGTIVGDDFGVHESLQITKQFGEPFRLSFSLSAGAGTQSVWSGSEARATADLFSTANWLGFGEIRDSAGNVITDFTTSSDSGFNYSQAYAPVPLPTAFWLLFSGFITCARLRK